MTLQYVLFTELRKDSFVLMYCELLKFYIAGQTVETFRWLYGLQW